MQILSAREFKPSRSPHRAGHLVTAALLLMLLPLAQSAPAFWRAFFCVPAAVLASLFLGGDWELTAEGVRILATPAMHITLACSGATFFILLNATLAGIAVSYPPACRPRVFLLIPPLAYLVTLIANGSRLVLGWYAAAVATRWLPPAYGAALHLAIGIFVFAPTLILMHALIMRRLHRVQSH